MNYNDANIRMLTSLLPFMKQKMLPATQRIWENTFQAGDTGLYDKGTEQLHRLSNVFDCSRDEGNIFFLYFPFPTQTHSIRPVPFGRVSTRPSANISNSNLVMEVFFLDGLLL